MQIEVHAHIVLQQQELFFSIYDIKHVIIFYLPLYLSYINKNILVNILFINIILKYQEIKLHRINIEFYSYNQIFK